MEGLVGEHFMQPGSQTAGFISPLIVIANCPELYLYVEHEVGPTHVWQLLAHGRHPVPEA